MLSIFLVSQGDALLVEYPDKVGIERVVIKWRGENVPFSRIDESWVTVIGADIDTAPGDHNATVSFYFEDGRSDERHEIVRVEKKSFPVTRLKVQSKYVELSPDDLARTRIESRRLGTVFRKISPKIHWDGSFGVPIEGGEGSNFGHRRVFNDQPRNPHSGADIAAKAGTLVRATNRGEVVVTGDFFFNGNTVIVDHGLGIYSVYLHLSKIEVEEGEFVDKEEVLGHVGATGRVTGPHLHWGFRIQNARVDPFSLLRLAP